MPESRFYKREKVKNQLRRRIIYENRRLDRLLLKRARLQGALEGYCFALKVIKAASPGIHQAYQVSSAGLVGRTKEAVK